MGHDGFAAAWIWPLLAAFGLIMAHVRAADDAHHGSVRLFRAGAHQVDVSPRRFPVIVNAMFTERTATNVVDPLYAKALMLDDGRLRIALCVVDTCMMDRGLIDRAKESAAAVTGIPIDRMLVCATHTHSAPAAMGCLGSRVDPDYAAQLPSLIAEAIAGAAAAMQPAQVSWGAVDDWEHTFNRRWIRRPDKMLVDPFGERTVRAHMHPGHESPDAIGPSGPVDPGLALLALRTREGQPLALWANYSQHYYDSPLLSSDYYGRFARHIATALGADPNGRGFVAMMSQGTSGDLMWMDYGSPRRDIGYDAYAREVSDRAMGIYRSLRWRNWVPLQMAERILSLNYRVPDASRLAWARALTNTFAGRLPQTLPEIYAAEALHLHARPSTHLKVQAIRVGGLGITAMPNEVFALTGLRLKAQSPLQPTMNVELANGAEGYIPPPEQHRLGGYTTWPARTAGLEVQAEPRIAEAALQLLEEVAGQKRRPMKQEHGPYARRVLADHPVAYWRFDDAVTPQARDASRHQHHALYEDGIALFLPGAGSGTGHLPHPQLRPSYFSGSQINRSAHFAGGRVRAQVPRLNDRYSAEMWIWNGLPHDVRPVTGWFFSRGNESELAGDGEHLGIGGTRRADEQGRVILFCGDESAARCVGRTVLGTKTWHHVVIVRDRGLVTLYVDGVLDATAPWASKAASGNSRVFLGGRSDNHAHFEGKLDEVALYRRALTAAEVRNHYRAAGQVSQAPSHP